MIFYVKKWYGYLFKSDLAMIFYVKKWYGYLFKSDLAMIFYVKIDMAIIKLRKCGRTNPCFRMFQTFVFEKKIKKSKGIDLSCSFHMIFRLFSILWWNFKLWKQGFILLSFWFQQYPNRLYIAQIMKCVKKSKVSVRNCTGMGAKGSGTEAAEQCVTPFLYHISQANYWVDLNFF